MTAAPKLPPRRKHATVGQHFLLSRAARTLPLARVFRMSEAEAYQAFRRARWPESKGATPWCPHCGCEGAYEYAPRTITAWGRWYRALVPGDAAGVAVRPCRWPGPWAGPQVLTGCTAPASVPA